MKRIYLLVGLMFTLYLPAAAQDLSADDLLGEIDEEMEEAPLLPERMLFTQRMLWGERGLYRGIGFAPKELTAESREKELKARRTMFKIHQATGFLAAGGMVAQAIIGPKLYNGNFQIRDLHEKVALGTNIAYGTTAVMALTSPPPMVNRKKFDNIKLHKILAVVHLSGMVATNVLAHQASEGNVNKNWHRAAAITTFGAYAAAIASIKFEF
ncbi:hypothetical protein [Jiulongibacter sediminis]|nr:hypothetical protein [Jiulongibacter sediminis]TBX23323.1 hypothetical protein TK44_13575 [Jiulongibacter sediminis]